MRTTRPRGLATMMSAPYSPAKSRTLLRVNLIPTTKLSSLLPLKSALKSSGLARRRARALRRSLRSAARARRSAAPAAAFPVMLFLVPSPAARAPPSPAPSPSLPLPLSSSVSASLSVSSPGPNPSSSLSLPTTSTVWLAGHISSRRRMARHAAFLLGKSRSTLGRVKPWSRCGSKAASPRRCASASFSVFFATVSRVFKTWLMQWSR
mmetsp:Transcript_9839/g.40612  ORF Transcript_9839/g.40612 Transcript_9839/m.40612 type:complete len:208 (-) Transcript_9839:692-1315(-)